MLINDQLTKFKLFSLSDFCIYPDTCKWKSVSFQQFRKIIFQNFSNMSFQNQCPHYSGYSTEDALNTTLYSYGLLCSSN